MLSDILKIRAESELSCLELMALTQLIEKIK